ncbi:Hypothetical protein GLP15_2666 [Giardia lamblia P15]|uniref:Uncharacterized protein n=1 Tax=Giardia intestinalis (strain P15) TaxID=658858 RepID=E1F4A3_GIAIA|nr:Hypothetical protein GLP15_2666 [Giardia lamblia P15]
MQILFSNDPECLVTPFVRAILYAGEIIGEDLQSWPLLEATSTPVQRAWVHALSEAPTGEVDLGLIIKLLKSMGLPDIRATTHFDQYLELILLSMPKLLVDRFFKCSLSCTACGYEHLSFFLSLPGCTSDTSFADAAKCLACKQCHQASFSIKESPTLMIFYNAAREKLHDVPVSYLDLGVDYELLSVIHSHTHGKKPKHILQHWVLDRNSNSANSLVYQFGRISSGVKAVPHKTVQAALMSAGEPTSSQHGILTFIIYLSMNVVPIPERAKYLSATSSLGSHQKCNYNTLEVSTIPSTGTVGLIHNETISEPVRPQSEMQSSTNTFQLTKSTKSYFDSQPKDGYSSQLLPSHTMQINTLLPTMNVYDSSQQKLTSAFETALLRIDELERKVNSSTVYRSLQYTTNVSAARNRIVEIAGLRIELWLLITLSVMGFLTLLTFILACIGITTPRTA